MVHSRPEFANGVLSCSLRTLTGASSIPRQRFEATNTTFQPVSFISFFLYSVQGMNQLLKFTLDVIRVKNYPVSVKTHCFSSSLKSSKLLFFFSFSLVFFWAWNDEKSQLQQKSNQNSEQATCCLVAVLTCLLSNAKKCGGVSKGKMLFAWVSKRDLGLYNFPLFSSAADSSESEKKID